MNNNINAIKQPYTSSQPPAIPLHIDLFPEETLAEIFSYLQASDLGRCCHLCKRWNVSASNAVLLKGFLRSIGTCDKEVWEKFRGENIGTEPSLPKNIYEILNAPCPIWEEEKVKETHELVLISNTFNLRNLISCVDKYFKISENQDFKPYQFPGFKDYLDTSINTSYWVLMTKDLLPGSRNKSYSAQKNLIAKLSETAQIEYQVPTVLEAAACMASELLMFGTRNTSFHNDASFTRCQETWNGYQLVVRDYIVNTMATRIGNVDGLSVEVFNSDAENCGVRGVRRLY